MYIVKKKICYIINTVHVCGCLGNWQCWWKWRRSSLLLRRCFQLGALITSIDHSCIFLYIVNSSDVLFSLPLQTCYSSSPIRKWSLEDCLITLHTRGPLPPKSFLVWPSPSPQLPLQPPPPHPHLHLPRPSWAAAPIWMHSWALPSPVAPQPQTRPSSLPPSRSPPWPRCPLPPKGSNQPPRSRRRASVSPRWSSPSPFSAQLPRPRLLHRMAQGDRAQLSARRPRPSSPHLHLRLPLSSRHSFRHRHQHRHSPNRPGSTSAARTPTQVSTHWWLWVFYYMWWWSYFLLKVTGLLALHVFYWVNTISRMCTGCFGRLSYP